MSKQGPKDPNETAFSILQKATGEADLTENEQKKNPAAVKLGRLGGLKGGRARAQKLSESERVYIAKQAAQKRWANEKENKGTNMKKNDELFNLRVLIRRDGDTFVARSADFEVIAQGSSDEDALNMLIRVFVSTRIAYERKGLKFEDCHPKAPTELTEIFERRSMFRAKRKTQVDGQRVGVEIEPVMAFA